MPKTSIHTTVVSAFSCHLGGLVFHPERASAPLSSEGSAWGRSVVRTEALVPLVWQSWAQTWDKSFNPDCDEFAEKTSVVLLTERQLPTSRKPALGRTGLVF